MVLEVPHVKKPPHMYLYIYTYIYIYRHACMHTYIHTYIHTYMNAYIQKLGGGWASLFGTLCQLYLTLQDYL